MWIYGTVDQLGTIEILFTKIKMQITTCSEDRRSTLRPLMIVYAIHRMTMIDLILRNPGSLIPATTRAGHAPRKQVAQCQPLHKNMMLGFPSKKSRDRRKNRLQPGRRPNRGAANLQKPKYGGFTVPTRQVAQCQLLQNKYKNSFVSFVVNTFMFSPHSLTCRRLTLTILEGAVMCPFGG